MLLRNVQYLHVRFVSAVRADIAVVNERKYCFAIFVYNVYKYFGTCEFLCFYSWSRYTTHLQQECHNSKFGIFELLV